MAKTNTDQDRAIECLSIVLGGMTLKVEDCAFYTGDRDNHSVIVSWGEDPSIGEGATQGCLVLDDGTVEVSNMQSNPPLEAWIRDWNKQVADAGPAPKIEARGPLPIPTYDPKVVPHQAAIEALVFELQDSRDDTEDEGGGYSEEELQLMQDTIDLLCELRDGSARVVRPG